MTRPNTLPTAVGRRASRDTGSDFDAWLAAVATTIRAVAARKGVADIDAHDLAQEVVISALQTGPSLMDRYPRATTYANARFDHGRTDWHRRQAVQRGEGARFERQQMSLNGPAPVGEWTWDDVVVTGDVTSETAHQQLASAETRSFVRRCLDPCRARALLAVKGYGVPVATYARSIGVARETASRWVASATRDLTRDLE
jgi:DNA-directed RNA polymerase specialized sigma24 family protein